MTWILPSEIATAIGKEGFTGAKNLTAQKVGRALGDLGYKDNPKVCRTIQSTADNGHVFEKRFYDWDMIRDLLRVKLVEKWPEVKLRDVAVLPAYLDTRVIPATSEVNAAVNAAVSSGTKWSHYQTAIFDEIKNGDGNVVVLARAGSGKTTTIIESLNHLPSTAKILLCAFNKDIQTELESRAPPHVTVRTMHSIGFELIRKNETWPKAKGFKRHEPIDKNKVRNIADKVLRLPQFAALIETINRSGHRDPKGNLFNAKGWMRKLVSLSKNTLATTNQQRQNLWFAHSIGESKMARLAAEAAGEILRRNDAIRDQIDFDDMIWFPPRFEYGVNKGTMLTYDVVLVDEAQDLNLSQFWMVNHLCKPGGRIIAFGDERQAIYGFRGADKRAIPKLIETLNAKTMPLSVSYRCAKQIVGLAQTIVPDIEWAPGAPEGVVGSCEYDDVIRDSKPGDFILSRINAPLMTTCLALLSRRKPAVIAGKDIGRNLEALIKRSKAGSTNELLNWLDRWLDEEREESMPQREAYYQSCVDKAAVLRILIDDTGSLGKLLMRLDELFSDITPESKIVCSTVHKAKGMERDRVWMLHDTFHPQSQVIEEQNIWYVAVTRAKTQLSLCETPVSMMNVA